jgi:Skp family chaperone for outer membrane proteins
MSDMEAIAQMLVQMKADAVESRAESRADAAESRAESRAAMGAMEQRAAADSRAMGQRIMERVDAAAARKKAARLTSIDMATHNTPTATSSMVSFTSPKILKKSSQLAKSPRPRF